MLIAINCRILVMTLALLVVLIEVMASVSALVKARNAVVELAEVTDRNLLTETSFEAIEADTTGKALSIDMTSE